MKNILLQLEITRIDDKTSLAGNPYFRASFKDKDGHIYKANFNSREINELAESINLVLVERENDYPTIKSDVINLSVRQATNKKGTPYLQEKTFTNSKGEVFKYLELLPIVFVENNLISAKSFIYSLPKARA